jgi:hypothetical protein
MLGAYAPCAEVERIGRCDAISHGIALDERLPLQRARSGRTAVSRCSGHRAPPRQSGWLRLLGWKPRRGAEADERDDCEDDHRGGVGALVKAGDEDGAGYGSAERRPEVGDTTRQSRDLTLETLGECGLHDVDGRGEHGAEAEADQQEAGREGPGAR